MTDRTLHETETKGESWEWVASPGYAAQERDERAPEHASWKMVVLGHDYVVVEVDVHDGRFGGDGYTLKICMDTGVLKQAIALADVESSLKQQ